MPFPNIPPGVRFSTGSFELGDLDINRLDDAGLVVFLTLEYDCLLAETVLAARSRDIRLPLVPTLLGGVSIESYCWFCRWALLFLTLEYYIVFTAVLVLDRFLVAEGVYGLPIIASSFSLKVVAFLRAEPPLDFDF